MKIRVVVDCNVIISAGLTKGVARGVVQEIVRSYELVLSETVVREYRDVIMRPKFAKYRDSLIEMVKVICLEGIWVDEPVPSTHHEALDKYDQDYLDLAVYAEAKYLITGNLKDFPATAGDVKIVSPKEFIEICDSTRRKSK